MLFFLATKWEQIMAEHVGQDQGSPDKTRGTACDEDGLEDEAMRLACAFKRDGFAYVSLRGPACAATAELFDAAARGRCMNCVPSSREKLPKLACIAGRRRAGALCASEEKRNASSGAVVAGVPAEGESPDVAFVSGARRAP